MTTFAPPPSDSTFQSHSAAALPSDDNMDVDAPVNGSTEQHNSDAVMTNGAADSHQASSDPSVASPADPQNLTPSKVVDRTRSSSAAVEDSTPSHDVSSLAVESDSQLPAAISQAPDSGIEIAADAVSAELESEPKSEPIEEPTTSQIISNMHPPAEGSPKPSPVAPLDGSLQSTPVTALVDSPMKVDTSDDLAGHIKTAREREDDELSEPVSKRTRVDDPRSSVTHPEPPIVTETRETLLPDAGSTPQDAASTGDDTQLAAGGNVASAQPVSSADIESNRIGPTFGDFGALTDAQQKKLLGDVRALKKAGYARAFLAPVDPVALGIPRYPEIIKEPMDLGTIDRKLKEKAYSSVNDYIYDLDLMVTNAIRFNGLNHAVSHAALSMRAVFLKQLSKVPKKDEPLPDPSPKPPKPSVSGPTRETQRRLSRPSLTATQSDSFAPIADGVPQIRRQSGGLDGRPKREIKKTAPREIPYAKPRKKKFETELAFCRKIVEELKKPKYQAFSFPFLKPVDPVALQIPDYHKIVKSPMDLSTVEDRLRNGQYENAKEFEQDVSLIFKACYKFNPEGHPVNAMGHQFEELWKNNWKGKAEYIKSQQPASEPQSSEEEEEEEESEPEQDDKDAKIAALHQQLAALQEQTLSLMQGHKPQVKKLKKQGKASKGAATAKSSKKSASTKDFGPAKAAPKPKKETKKRQVTQKEKNEIANRIGELPNDKIAQAAEMIKSALRKAGQHDLAAKTEDELEFDIDVIPNDALHSLLRLIRDTLPNPTGPPAHDDDSDYDHPAPKKSKKRRATTKQADHKIQQLEQKLQTFQPGSAGGQGQLGSAPGESSGDEDDSGSESEEE